MFYKYLCCTVCKSFVYEFPLNIYIAEESSTQIIYIAEESSTQNIYIAEESSTQIIYIAEESSTQNIYIAEESSTQNISIVKPTRCTIFRVYWISLYMFRSVFPSIIRSPRLYIQRQICISYRFVDCLLASSQRTCMTYTWSCMYSLELLMMDGKTARNV